MRREPGTLCLLVMLCVIVAILNAEPALSGNANLQNMARLIGAYGVFSVGLGIVIITGGLICPVGLVFALLGGCCRAS